MHAESLGRGGEHVASPLAPLSEDECWLTLEHHTLGRIAIVVSGQPAIFPVNYRAGKGAIVFRSAQGEKVAEGPMQRACFEIDGFDNMTGTGWSVMVKGVLQEITSAADPRASSYLQLPVQPAAPGPREHWLALYATSVSGRHFTSGQELPS